MRLSIHLQPLTLTLKPQTLNNLPHCYVVSTGELNRAHTAAEASYAPDEVVHPPATPTPDALNNLPHCSVVSKGELNRAQTAAEASYAPDEVVHPPATPNPNP